MAEAGIGEKYEMLVVGGSAGSLDAILYLLPRLQEVSTISIVLVLHRRSGESVLASLLGDKVSWPVKEAEEKEAILPGTIYIAPADYHLLIEKDKTFSLDYSEKINYSRPAIDVTFETAAEAYGTALIALLLSGANSDGTEGLKKVKATGGYTVVQEPSDAPVAYMPQYAISQMKVDSVAAVSGIPSLVRTLVG